MKLKVWNESPKEEQPIYLRLIDEGNGNVQLRAVDQNGELLPAGRLLSFSPDGFISRIVSVNKDLGFSLDGCGRLHIS